MFERSTSDARPDDQERDRHRCLAGPACRHTEHREGHRVGARTTRPDVFCDACAKHIADACRQLPEHYRQLRNSLGDHSSNTADYVRSTPTPAIPINTTAEALMTAICDIAERAATAVADQLHTDTPDGRDRLNSIWTRHGETYDFVDATPGSIADRTHQTTQPDRARTLHAHIRLIEPHIELLAAAPPQPHLVWNTRGYHLDYNDPTAVDLIELSGADLAQQLRDIHHQARAHLGQTRLRHHYSIPCPATTRNGTYCGATTVGRDDGSDWVDCTTCGTQWTEREYDWLKTQIAGDKEIDMLRYLLAEGYFRLDQIRAVIDDLSSDPAVRDSEAVKLIVAAIQPHLEGHATAAERGESRRIGRKKK